jgi:hypothetical protein
VFKLNNSYKRSHRLPPAKSSKSSYHHVPSSFASYFTIKGNKQLIIKVMKTPINIAGVIDKENIGAKYITNRINGTTVNKLMMFLEPSFI